MLPVLLMTDVNIIKIFFDEWNYIGFERDVPGDFWMNIRNDDTPELAEENVLNQRSEVGASYVAAAFIKMNELPIDMAHYYDGQCTSSWCGLFNYFSIPQKPYYSFLAYGDIYANCASLVETTCELENMYAGIEISDKAMRCSQNSAGAFVNLLNDEIENMIKEAQRRLTSSFYTEDVKPDWLPKEKKYEPIKVSGLSVTKPYVMNAILYLKEILGL